MSEARHPEPFGDRLLRLSDRVYGYLEDFLTAVAALFIFVLMLLGVGEVIGRRLLNKPIPGHIDIVEVMMITFTMLAIAYCQRHGGHIRMELLVSKLRGRVMWAVELFGILVALFLIYFIIQGAWSHFLRSLQIGDSTLDIQLPTWPSKLLAAVALAVLWGRLWLQLWAYIRMLLRPDADPIAIPVTKGVIDQAREEIDSSLGRLVDDHLDDSVAAAIPPRQPKPSQPPEGEHTAEGDTAPRDESGRDRTPPRES
jgi:C4-dicarboxylate transporter, DctQ subunit